MVGMGRSDEGAPDPQLAWIVWGALVLSIPVYGAVLVLAPMEGGAEPELLRLFRLALPLAAAAEIVAIVVVRKVMFFGPLEEGEFEDLDELHQGYFTTSIVTWALAESIAIYGFVLSFLGAPLAYFWGFAVVAILLDLYYRPDFDGIESTFESNRTSSEDDQTW